MQHQRVVRPNRLERSITAFCYVPVSDFRISPNHLVLLVHNISDADMRRSKKLEPLMKETPKGLEEAGKPSGWGMPGGGMKAEDSNDPKIAAETELKSETGLEIKKVTPFLTEYKLIELDREGVMIGQPIYFELGKRPSITMSSRHHAIENPIYVFKTEARWEGSALQKLLHSKMEKLLSLGETSADDIAEDGMWIWFDSLTPEELESLNIEEKDEIDGIGVFSVQMVLNERPSGFYKSHIRRIHKGLETEQEKLDSATTRAS